MTISGRLLLLNYDKFRGVGISSLDEFSLKQAGEKRKAARADLREGITAKDRKRLVPHWKPKHSRMWPVMASLLA